MSYGNPMGRKKRWAEDMQARFTSGTFARIEAVLRDGEDRTDFIRDAVEKELKRRGTAQSRLPSDALPSSATRARRAKSSP
jgi:hypothetical protein